MSWNQISGQKYWARFIWEVRGVMMSSNQHSISLITCSRSTGYGSLEVWIRYLRQGVTYQETYSASNKCTKSNWQGGSITIAGGYVWSDAYEVSNQENVVIVGGGDPVCRDKLGNRTEQTKLTVF